MPIYTCAKCGKEYKRKGYYDKHIKDCTGKKPSPKVKKRVRKPKIVDKNDIVKRVDNIELRLSNLEEEFKNLDLGNHKNRLNRKKAINLPINNEIELVKIIKNIIKVNTNLYSIKGMIPLEDLKDIMNRNYNLTEKSFEDIILKLYRKEYIDLHAGGTPDSYLLKSPTGKEFYYLMVKEN